MKMSGPFRLSRHPLNFAMLPIIWMMPRMTVNLAAFNLVTTLYSILGSVHEERRLKAAYGRAYADYQTSGVNFFVPSLIASTNIAAEGDN
jgi:protein-S-isoprenylcysteine O-methyltransferase Ste14